MEPETGARGRQEGANNIRTRGKEQEKDMGERKGRKNKGEARLERGAELEFNSPRVTVP